MKKVALGCLVVLVLGCVGVGGVAFWAYRRVQQTVSQFSELAQVPDIERQVVVKDPFEPPASEELTSTQLERFLGVQAAIRERLGVRFAEFEKQYKVLSEKDKPTLADVPTLMAGYRDLALMWLDAKRSQVEALNAAKLSLDEYRWIRDQAYTALGIPYVDLDIGKIADDIRSGQTTGTNPGQVRGSIGPAGPEANRTLVEAHRKQLEANVAMASFGL
jgi:hypothetical protein